MTGTDHINAGLAKRILCVEDDADTCELLTIVLRDYDFECLDSKAAFFRLFDEREADLYILDNWLPDGSGIEICRAIRERFSHAPIIFTSAVARKIDIGEAMAAGADRYLLKPCEPEDLKRVVKELLERPIGLPVAYRDRSDGPSNRELLNILSRHFLKFGIGRDDIEDRLHVAV